MDRRTLWAVMLMMAIAFVPTFFMKKPARPVAPAAFPGAAIRLRAPRRPRRHPWCPCRTCSRRGGTGPGHPVPADTITVTTPLARYGVSTRGGVLTSLELERYKSTAPASQGHPGRTGAHGLAAARARGRHRLGHAAPRSVGLPASSRPASASPASRRRSRSRRTQAGHCGAHPVHLLAQRLSGGRVGLRHRRRGRGRPAGARAGHRAREHRGRFGGELPRGGTRHLRRQRRATRPGQAHGRRDGDVQRPLRLDGAQVEVLRHGSAGVRLDRRAA